MHRVVIAIVCALNMAGQSAPPAPVIPAHGLTPQGPLIQAKVRQVLVPVVVTDGSGRYIADLTAAGFSVYEDDVLQKIVAFSRAPVPGSPAEESQGRVAAHSRTAQSNRPPARTYLICIDTLHSEFDNFARVRKALKDFFRKEETGDSQYALFALGRELHVITDSTRDPEVILTAISSKDLLKTIRDSEARNLANATEEFVGLVGAWCESCQCTSITMDMAGIGCPGLKGQVRAASMSFSQRTAGLNATFVAELTRLVSAMSTMPTKRTMVYLSDGFNRFAGQEFTNILQAFNVADPAMKFNSQDLQPQLEKLLKLAVRDNVRFYTIDARGLYTYSSVPGSGEDASSTGVPSQVRHAMVQVAWQNSDAMAELAKQTGGAFFENSNDLLRGIRRAFADGREEYVLAYVPINATYDGKFRHITVKVKNKDAQVSAKAGYWASP